MTGTSYAQTRREIIGYHFFRHIAFVCWCFIIVIGIFSAAVNPIEMYFLESGEMKLDIKTSTATVMVNLSPMFQVGVTIGTIGFGSYFAMLMIWLLLLAFAYLPADSDGLLGWFKGKTINKGDEEVAAALSRDEYLILISKEVEVKHLLALKRREMKAPGELHIPRILRQQKHGFLSSMRSSAFLTQAPLISQVRANVLVLETEILLFHFMHLSYVLPGKKFDPKTNTKVPLTMEEKKMLVEDPSFVLYDHIIDEDTDTHVMVFVSEDRVVVAFRGSVSMTNWQTDFDSSEVVCEYVKNIQPDFSDIPTTNMRRARKVASKPPLVHGGFVKAYETVRSKITDIVGQLAKENHNRVIFVTGHSLGGGLAILCSVDLAVTLRLPPSLIALTTWGCPKVGTFSFITRFNRVCPCAHRFVMADDIITKLPMDPAFQAISLNGWWHAGTEILLNDVGNMLIRPTPIERFMFQRTIGSPAAHLRMTYCTSLMIWVIRSHPDYKPDWWIGVVTLFYKNANKRLRRLPPNLRDRLEESLLKPGVSYNFNKKTVRDMMVDTNDKPAAPVLAAEGDRIATAMEEPDYSTLATELLVAIRMRNESNFDRTLDTLIELRAKKMIFLNEPDVPQSHKRNQQIAGMNEQNEPENAEKKVAHLELETKTLTEEREQDLDIVSPLSGPPLSV